MEEGNFEIDTKKLVRYTAYFCCSGFFGAVFTNGVMGRPYFFRTKILLKKKEKKKNDRKKNVNFGLTVLVVFFGVGVECVQDRSTT